MLKVDFKEKRSDAFLFNGKYCIRSLRDRIWIRYRWDDDSFFLSFSSKRKVFRESLGFGFSKKMRYIWWKISVCNWLDLE